MAFALNFFLARGDSDHTSIVTNSGNQHFFRIGRIFQLPRCFADPDVIGMTAQRLFNLCNWVSTKCLLLTSHTCGIQNIIVQVKVSLQSQFSKWNQQSANRGSGLLEDCGIYGVTLSPVTVICSNTKMSALATNSFNKINRVRCFAHTLNLIAKSILKPFSTPEKKKDGKDADGGDNNDNNDNIPDLVSDTASFDGVFADKGEAEEDAAMDLDMDSDAEDNDEVESDEWEEMGDEEKMAFDANTWGVKKSLDKLCTDKKFKERIIPRDVRTRWNSTYDMLASLNTVL
ncbi:hypothetical protein B0H14DRAFT_2587317 [Mycena olivaceomarginata]|nr:hypothetical protein B0H14DRAFT_2587317 [Mycena olivaceomarginata]